MQKKVVVFGGGTGMSFLLKGLKNFPVDISAVVTVSDDGKSTGKIREEFNMPAVGDLRRILISLSDTDSLLEELFNYRFKTNGTFNDHVIGNIILAGLSNITGNLSNSIKSLDKILKLKGKVIPLSEKNLVLCAKMEDNSIIKGEHNITESSKKIKKVYYEGKPTVNKDVLTAIKGADLIVLSMGSIYTSVIPNLLIKEVIEEIDKNKKAKIMYVCNMVTQPGETDDFKVSDHIILLNKYLGKKKIEVVIANNKRISKDILKIYETKEQKDQVLLDKRNLKDIDLIEYNLYTLEDKVIRHDSKKLGFLIISYIFNYKNS